MAETADFLNELNEWYYRLEMKQAEIVHALYHRVFELESGYYNGYQRRDGDAVVTDYFPIPVITVKGVCDVEIHPDHIEISAYRNLRDTVSYSFDKISGCTYTVSEAEDADEILFDSKTPSLEREHILLRSSEKKILFSFFFDFNTDGTAVYEFAKLLRRERFYQ